MTTVNKTGSTRIARIGAVVGAAVAGLIVWIVAQGVLDGGLRAPGFGDQGPRDVALAAVIVAPVLAGLAAWALLGILERRTSAPRRVWTIVALVVLIVSLSAPLSGSGVEGADRVALLVEHLAVGAVLIAGLGRTASPTRRGAPATAAA
jgi:hypothetical protein